MAQRKKRRSPTTPEATRDKLLSIEKQLNETFIRRADAIRVMLISVCAQVNYLFIGDPGTAKSAVIDTFTQHVSGGNRWKIQMGRFTQPEDVFGPLDIAAYKEGRREVVTDGMMPTCPFPVLDEVLKASDGCINTLLEILQERTFKGAPTEVVCAGAATNWPEVDQMSKHIEALYDRFVLRVNVTCVPRDNKSERRALYRAATALREYTPRDTVTVEELRRVHDEVLKVHIDDHVIDMVDSIVTRLATAKKDQHVYVSDRRATALQVVLQANAWLEGREQVSVEDMDVLRFGMWTKRADMENVISTLETVDASAVQEILDMVDSGRGAYRTLQSQGFGAAQATQVMDEIHRIVVEVMERVKKPVFTKGGRSKIKKSMAGLRRDFEDLVQRVGQHRGTNV